MNIKRVLIQNFRCFEKAAIELQKCHALVGENGSGKTSILEAIVLATSTGMSYLSEQDFNTRDAGNMRIEVFFDEPFLVKVPDGYASQDIPCQSVVLEAHRREKAAAGRVLSEPFVTEKYAVPVIYEKGAYSQIKKLSGNIPDCVKVTDKGYEAPRKSGTIFTFTKQRLSLQNETVNYPEVVYFDRKREDESKVGFNSLLSKVAKDLNWQYRKNWDQKSIGDSWQGFYEQAIKTVMDPKNDRIIKPIQEKLSRIAGCDFKDLELSLLDIEQPFSKAFLSKRSNTNQIDQRNFGSGVSILLSYFLLETIFSLNKHETIFLIDEPELHLHPQLQQRLFEEFRALSFQVLYTTQSDCFISIADWKSISRFGIDVNIFPKNDSLAETCDGKKISEHLDEILKWHQHKTIFFREDNQLFFARKVLLVEGPAEKYGLPVIAQKAGISLEGLTILSCNGKGKIPYYQLLCKSFNIPYFTIYDLDSKNETEDSNKRIKDWSSENGSASFRTSFESILGIGSDAEHKCGKILAKIDEINKDTIPEEILDVIKSAESWVTEKKSNIAGKTRWTKATEST